MKREKQIEGLDFIMVCMSLYGLMEDGGWWW